MSLLIFAWCELIQKTVWSMWLYKTADATVDYGLPG